MAVVVPTQLSSVLDRSPRAVGNDELVYNQFPDRRSAQLWKGRGAIPVHKVRTQEFHEKKLTVILEARTIPIGRPEGMPPPRPIEPPGENVLGGNRAKVKILENDHHVMHPGVT